MRSTTAALLMGVCGCLFIANDAIAAGEAAAQGTKHPPLQAVIDRKAIDRNLPDRVSYAAVVKRTAPSVVYVYSSKKIRGQTVLPFLGDPLFQQFFGPGRSEGRVQIPDQVQQGLGSGIVISKDGYILTNNHVVSGADEVKVALGDSNRRYVATVVGTDEPADIAVLRISADGLQPATFGDSDQLQVGDGVLAIGDPFGIGQSVSRGIVSALGRGPGIEGVEDFIQTDAAINPGNSGGALLDAEGRVVGLNTAIVSSSHGFAGVGFAIPSNLARNVARQIVDAGHVNRGFLGVATQELTPELADQFKTGEGALVAEVTPGSPGDKAGLASGDVITRINDVPINSAQRLLLTISELPPGTEITVGYLRDGQTHTAQATLSKRPRSAAMANLKNQPGDGKDVGVLSGVAVGDLTPDVRDQLQIPARIQGAIITNIDPTSPSYQQGLREGDVILDLDRKAVPNADAAVRLSEEIKGPKVMVRIWRDGSSHFVVIDESNK